MTQKGSLRVLGVTMPSKSLWSNPFYLLSITDHRPPTQPPPAPPTTHMDLHSPLITALYGFTTAALATLTQWFWLPEVGLPDLAVPLHSMVWEQILHLAGAISFGYAAWFYYYHNPKVFREAHFGLLLVASALQHVLELGMHQLGAGTVAEIWRQNKIMNTYGVAVLVLHGLLHKGLGPLFRKLAQQPLVVYTSMLWAWIHTLVLCAVSWTLPPAHYPASIPGENAFFGRVAGYFVTIGLVGFGIVEHILLQQVLVASKQKKKE